MPSPLRPLRLTLARLRVVSTAAFLDDNRFLKHFNMNHGDGGMDHGGHGGMDHGGGMGEAAKCSMHMLW